MDGGVKKYASLVGAVMICSLMICWFSA